MEYIIYILLFLVLILSIDCYINYKRSKLLKFRVIKYTIDDEKVNEGSILEWAKDIYYTIINETSKILLKSKAMKKLSFRYTKYLNSVNNKDIIQMNYISKKIYLGLIFMFISFIYIIINSYNINILYLILTFILGYYVYDFILIYRFYKRKKSVQDNLLSAIMIMNNTFKSGKSVMQSIKVVSEELDGPISNEFNKMYTEISYGLSLEIVFQRFLSRTKIEELKYITSSLTILNKTGGNIVNVFDSIEKTLLNKKEYIKEKNSLVASSVLLIKFLLLVPIIIFFTIFFIDNTYFNPLFTTLIGKIIIVLLILYYILYILIVKKILRVRVH